MFSRRLSFVAAAAAVLAFLLGPQPMPVMAVVLEATTDVWLRESGPDTTFESDLMSVWNSFGNDAGTRRYGVVEFDVSSLSGVTVDFAFLQLWGDAFGFSDDSKDIKQFAVQIDTSAGTQASAMTWNAYQNEYAGGATTLEGLGAFDLTDFSVPPPSQFYNSSGTGVDRSLIESIASGAGNQRLTVVMIADEDDGVEYAHSWGDGPDGFSGMNARLVINEVPPENQDFQLQVNSTTGAMSIVNPAVLTAFDFDGYVIQSASGSLDPVGWNSLEDQGLPGWQEVAPSANALTELNLTMQTQLAAGESLSFGNGFSVGGMEDLSFQYNVAGGAAVSGQVLYVTGGPNCDLDGSGGCGLDDIDRLYDEIFAGTDNPDFDFNGDGTVDNDDIEGWLTAAGTENGKTYESGDTNLDGDVGGSDFTTLAVNFGNSGADPSTVNAYFRHGNFDGNGTNNLFEVGGPDFTQLAVNFGFVSPVVAVPEPASGTLLLIAGLFGIVFLAPKKRQP